MRVLVVGNGGREHALVWKLRQSPQVTELFCAPGNPGIAALADCVPIDGSNIVELADFALSVNINLTVVGPELPLDLGIVDEFEKRNLPIFGPSETAAELESSKVFAKEFMRKHKIPTGRFEIAGSIEEARGVLKKGDMKLPVVLKADGLAGGKGVLICETKKHVEEALELFMTERKFGNAGDRIVVEEFLEGIEISFQVISDGKKVLPLATSQDHKKLFEGDRGPNTGGMGAFSPALSMNKEMHLSVMNQVILPAVAGMAAEGRPYRGVLYAGLMLTKQGPRVLEFNCRFGDPETQSLLPRMECDLAGVLMSAVTGRLDEAKVEWKREAAVCVVVASAGYPGTIESGREITGIDQAEKLENVIVFHAGTAKKDDKLVSSGGRVLGVTATAPHLSSACDRAYAAIGKIQFEGMQYRKDIAQKALQHLGNANKLE